MKVNEQIPQQLRIPLYNITDKTFEEFDNLTHDRFNINNFSHELNQKYKFKNYYVFLVKDTDTDSSTGFYGMCINKEFYKNVKAAMDNYYNKQN